MTRPEVFWCGFFALSAFAVVNDIWFVKGPEKSQRKKAIALSWGTVPFIYLAAVWWAALFIPPVPESVEGFVAPPDPHHTVRLVWAGILALGPPLYFFAESAWLYGPGFGDDADYKANQDLASKVWVAISVVLYLYWFGKA